MEELAAAVVVAAVIAVLGWPLLRPGRGDGDRDGGRATLDAAKEAKYRELRDAELDYHAGKLSEPEWRVLDAELRAEAAALLRDTEEQEAGER